MNPLLQMLLAALQNQQQPQQNNSLLSLLGGGQQQTPEQQLMALLQGNQQPPQNNQLLSLLGGQQAPQGGDVNQQLLTLLLKQQGQQQTPEQQLLALLQGNQNTNQQQPNNTAGGLDMAALAKLLQPNNTGGANDPAKSIIDILKEAQTNNNTEKDKEQNLEKLVTLKSDLRKFVEDNTDLFPDYFDFEATVKEVEKWAVGVDQITQGWTAAISKAFFEVEANRDALEERDRNLIDKNITKVSDREVNRDEAWGLLGRSAFNLKRLDESGAAPAQGNDKAVDAYGARFDLGAKADDTKAADAV